MKSIHKNIGPASGAVKTAIGKATLGLSVIAVFSKVFGFAEKLIVANFFGTDSKADVYFVSMGIVLSLVFLVKELISPSVLPIFAQVLKISSFASADLFRKIFFKLLLILLVFAVIAVVFSGSIIGVLVPGFSEDKKILTSSLLRFLAPACFFMCLMTFTQSLLNCRKNFLKAAIPEAGFKLFMVVGLVFLFPIMDVYALAATAITGSLVAFVFQFFLIPESRVVLAYSVYEANDEFDRILKLMGPLVVGVVFSHISGLIDNMLASTLPTGELSFLGYSKKLIDAVVLIGPVALVTVVYSQLSHLNAEDKTEEFRALFTKVLRLILFVSIPISVVLVLLREPVVAALFERGRFTQESTFGTSQALFIYATGVVTFAVEALVVYSFYALCNTKVPVRIGVLCVILDIILAVSLIKPFGFAAIAWAYVFSKTLKVIILLLIMNREIRFLNKDKFLGFVFRVIVSCLVSGFCLYLFSGLDSGNSFLQKFIFDLLVPAAGFSVVFFLCCWLFKIEEFNLFLVILRTKKLKSQLIGEMS